MQPFGGLQEHEGQIGADGFVVIGGHAISHTPIQFFGRGGQDLVAVGQQHAHNGSCTESH